MKLKAVGKTEIDTSSGGEIYKINEPYPIIMINNKKMRYIDIISRDRDFSKLLKYGFKNKKEELANDYCNLR